MRKRLVTEYRQLIADQRKMLDLADREKRSMTSAESQSYDRMTARLGDIAKEIERIDAHDDAAAALTETEGDRGTRPDPSRMYRGDGTPQYRMTPEGREIRALRENETFAQYFGTESESRNLSVGAWLRGIVTNNWEHASAERALTTVSPGGGSVLMPAPMSNAVIDMVRASSVMFPLVYTFPMTSKVLTIPMVTGDPTPNWRAETARILPSDPSFDGVEFEAKNVGAMVKVSRELVDDAPIDLERLLMDLLTKAFAQSMDRIILFGRGKTTYNEPLGIWNTPGILSVDMGEDGGALSNYHPLSEAFYKVVAGNFTPNGYLWNARTAGQLDILTADTDGQYLTPPPSLSRVPKLVTNVIPNDLAHGDAEDATFALTGDFKQVYVGLRQVLRIEVSHDASDPEDSTHKSAFTQNMVFIRATARMDVALKRTNAICAVKGIIPPA